MEEKNTKTNSKTKTQSLSSYSDEESYSCYSDEEVDYSSDNDYSRSDNEYLTDDDYSSDKKSSNKNKIKVLIDSSSSDEDEYEDEYEYEDGDGEKIRINEIKFQADELKNEIVKIEKKDNINILYIDKNLNIIDEGELLKLINKNYNIISEEGTGGQAVVKNIGNNLVARFSDDFRFDEKKHVIKSEVIEYMQKYKQEKYSEIESISDDEIIEYIKKNNQQKYEDIYNISNDKIIKYIKKNNFAEYEEIEKKVKQARKKLEDFNKKNVQNNIIKNIPLEKLEEYKNNYIKEKYSKILKNYREILFTKKLKNYIFFSENLKDYKTYIIKEKLNKYIENNNEILSHLKGIKTGSTIPINSLVIVGENGYKTIEISKLRKKGNLKNAKKDKNQKNLSSISRIGQLIKAFKNEHVAGIIHRDIKAKNILVDENDKLTAADYGLASIIGKEIPRYCGTIGHVAPEIFEKELRTKDITQKIDVYSLGIMFFEELLECGDIYEFTKTKYKQFCDNEKDKNKKTLRYFFSEYSKKITEDINKDIIYLDNFLPKEIINNVNNKNKINKLKEKFIVFLKHMLIADPKKRATIFEVEKEFDEIIVFILENLKKMEKDGTETALTREDLLFLDKSELQQQVQSPEELQKQEEIKNRKLYDLKEFSENTIKAASNKFKKSLEKLLEIEEEKQYKDGILFDRYNEENEEQLDIVLNNLELKKPLSKNAKNCLNILKNCIIEENNVKLPDKSFYNEMNDLKNNTKEYLTVMNKLIQLRELKLAIEIQKLEKIESDLGEENLELKEEIKKLREFRNDIKLTTRVYKNEEIAEGLFVKNKKSRKFKNLFEEFQKKELELQDLNKKLIDSYINTICSKQKGYPKLIRTLFDKISSSNELYIVYNKLFSKAIENKSIDVLITLIKRDIVILDDRNRKKINDCTEVICSGDGNLELMNTIIDKIKYDRELLSSFINDVFNKIQNKDNNVINNLLINNFNKIVTIFNEQQNFELSLFVPFEAICINEGGKYSELIENFINNLVISENCINTFKIAYINNCPNIMNKLFTNENSKKVIIDNIIANRDCSNIINNIFDFAYNNDCFNIIDTLFKDEKLKEKIKNTDNEELLYKAISNRKTKIARKLINRGIKFNKKNIENLVKKYNESFTSFKKNLAKMANIDFKGIENIKMIEKKDIFNNKKYYIDENDFAELENTLNLISQQNTNDINL